VPLEDVLSRVQEIAALAGRVADPAAAHAAAGAFASALRQAPGWQGPIGRQPDALPWMPGGSSLPLTPYAPQLSPSYGFASPAYAPSQPGLRALAVAAAEIGVQEEPPGSNDGARIAEYRTATAGAAGTPGRWCAYFVSWAAAQAGAPLGDSGHGYGSVAQVEEWARRTGRLVPAGELPRPGDIVLYGADHIGIVESVGPGERLTTVEGNHSDRVERVDRTLGEATGFVRL
jgi:hypothetical protein